MNKILILIVLLASGTFVFGQKDFRPGYIVKGVDTLKGLVQYRGGKTFDKAVFKNNGRRQKATTYLADDLSAYGFIDDKKYESIDIDSTSAVEKTFALVLGKGAIDLYYIKNKYFMFKENRMTILYVKPDSIISKKKGNASQEYFTRDMKYVQQVSVAVADCGMMTNDLQFSRSALSKIIKEYNQCKHDYVDVSSRKKMITVGASAAFSIFDSKLKIDTLPNNMFDSNPTFAGELNVEIRFPRLLDKFALNVGFKPVKSTYTSTNTVTSTVQRQRDDMTLQVQYFMVPLSLRFNFGGVSNSLYAKAGMSLGKLQSENFSSVRSNYALDGTLLATSTLRVRNGYRNPFGVLIAIGYDKRIVGRFRTFAELRYEDNSGFIGTQIAPFSRFTTIGFLAGIGF